MQRLFYESDCDIVLAGSGAGTGKTLGLLLLHTKHLHNPSYRGTIFRRTYAQITNTGSILDESLSLYPLFGGQYNSQKARWVFPSGATVDFRHLQHEKTKYEYQGSQIAGLCFDELTHMTEDQFWYLLSRNRSVSGVRPFCRATCNPDADSWVAKLVDWYLDERGYPDHNKSGVIRYFYRRNGETFWDTDRDALIFRWLERQVRDDGETLFVNLRGGELRLESRTVEDLAEQVKVEAPEEIPIKSFTLLPGSIYENKKLLETNPEYLANLEALHPVERERLLKGNWKIVFEAGLVINRAWFNVVDEQFTDADLQMAQVVRFWDFAATPSELAKSQTSWTVGCKMVKFSETFYLILDVTFVQIKGGEVRDFIEQISRQDGDRVAVRWEMEGGSSGKTIAELYEDILQESRSQVSAKAVKPQGNKLQRALPFATAAKDGHIYLVRSPWNDQFLNACQQFDGSHKALVNDIVDACDGAYNELAMMPIYADPFFGTVDKQETKRFGRVQQKEKKPTGIIYF